MARYTSTYPLHGFANITSNILSLPFRKTHSISLSDAIKQYISSKYDQHPDMFKQDLEVIDALRRDAVHVREPHISGIRKISAYAGQLSWMGGKFPIDVSSAALAHRALLIDMADWSGLHMVPSPRLQHRPTSIPEQPQIRIVQRLV